MIITHQSGLFIAKSERYEAPALKAANFTWHPGGGQCFMAQRNKPCAGCQHGVAWAWWTDSAQKASKLRECLDDAAVAAVAAHDHVIETSRAADSDAEIPCPEGLAYLPFQRAGIAYMAARRRVIMADEQGLGKSIETAGLWNSTRPAKTLIVCPASLRLNWQREAQKWCVGSPDVRVPTKLDQLTGAIADAAIVIVNFERLRMKDWHVAIMAAQWNLLVVDEAHKAKNPKAQQTIALLGGTNKDKSHVVGVIDRSDRAVFLTGTPIVNRPVEAWGLVHACAPDQFPNFFGYAKRYCGAFKEEVKRGTWVWNFNGATNLDELQDRLRATCMVRRLKADVLKELPAKRRQVVMIPRGDVPASLFRAERDAYQYDDDSFEELDEMFDDDSMDDLSGLAVEEAAKRISGQKRSFEEISKVRIQLGLAKAEFAVEFLTDTLESAQKLVVMCHHQEVVETIRAGLEPFNPVVVTGDTAMKARQDAVDRFQADDSVRVFIGTIGAAGVGLTLTAASQVVMVESSWTPAENAQAEDRCIGKGQPILTPDGWRPIEDIKIGDKVISSNGSHAVVTDAWSSGSTRMMAELMLEGWPEPVVTTFDHKFLVNINGNPSWIKAEDIKPGHRVMMPTVDVSTELTGIQFDDDCRLPETFFASGVEQRNSRLIKMPEIIAANDEMLFTTGYYAGDGFSSTGEEKGRFVSFYGNKTKKKSSIDRCAAWMDSIGINSSLREDPAGQGVELRSYSGEMALWFKKHFGHMAVNKRLPGFCLRLNQRQSRIVLEGLIASDGYVRKGRYEFSTMSKTLAAHVAIVMARSGYRPCLTHGSTGQTIVAYTDNGATQDSLVRSITLRYPQKIDGKREPVYDLTVEGSHSFVVGMAVVHNCHRISQQNSVLIQYLLIDGTMDARIMQMVVGKADVADRMLDRRTDTQVAIPAAPKSSRKSPAGAPRHPVATPAQREAAAQAMRILAGSDTDRCAEKNGVGFNQIDIGFGHELANRSMARDLTDGEVAVAAKIAKKYHRQLGKQLIAAMA